jgi:hypothetical protein
VERFILAEDADVDMPTGKRHLDAGTPVAFNGLGMQYAALKGKLRAEDPERDHLGQAAIVLDSEPFLPSGRARGLRN